MEKMERKWKKNGTKMEKNGTKWKNNGTKWKKNGKKWNENGTKMEKMEKFAHHPPCPPSVVVVEKTLRNAAF